MPFLKGIGWPELVIILVIVLILFGPKRLPQLGKMLGKTVRNVRDGMEGKLEAGDDDDDVFGEKAAKAEPAKSEAKSEDKPA